MCKFLLEFEFFLCEEGYITFYQLYYVMAGRRIQNLSNPRSKMVRG